MDRVFHADGGDQADEGRKAHEKRWDTGTEATK